MSSDTSKHDARRSGRKVFWRSLDQAADPTRFDAESRGSDIVKGAIAAQDLNRLGRRNFLTLSGAIGTLAGIEGCIRRPVEKIVPYSEPPAEVPVGDSLHFATVTERRGEALGLMVTSREGRPIKIEGNPEHPTSGGATDLWAQAALLDLYDADRARQPTRQGVPQTVAEIDAMLGKVVAKYQQVGGQGLHVLAQPINSPTFLRLREQLLRRLPKARVHTYSPLNESNVRAGTKLAFGTEYMVEHRFDKAKVVLALDSDFLLSESGGVRSMRDFAAARRLESSKDQMNRLYVVEPSLTVTGSNADHRLRLAASQVFAYLRALGRAVASHGIDLGPVGGAVGDAETPAGVPARWIEALAKDLVDHRREAVIVVGSRQPPVVHALAHVLNRALGPGQLFAFTEPVDASERDNVESLKELTQAMASGSVETLVILGGNPVYDAPADLGFSEALSKVGTSIRVSSHLDETAERCHYHVPRAHELETWGDQLSRGMHYAIQQPLIAPLWGGRSDIEMLGILAGEANWRGYFSVRATASARGLADDRAFDQAVQKGVYKGGERRVTGGLGPKLEAEAVASAVRAQKVSEAPSQSAMEAVFLADNKLFDGRHANNFWLLEMPDPITRITWDNAALFAPSTARALGIDNGDMVRLSSGSESIDIVAWLQPGQAPYSIGLPLGWGRRAAGSHGNGAGFNVYPLRTAAAPAFVGQVKVQKLGSRYPISQTQEHDIIDTALPIDKWYAGQAPAERTRPVLIDADLADYRQTPNFAEWEIPDPSVPPLWETRDYTHGPQWGMTIDLNACTGCSSCVIACQSENNIPVVGKDEVARGREMHWIRIDRYYSGDVDEPEVAFQPLACQHCEEAPCENVCPVNATSHSPEGLNDIAYNRCIGTRYCMNNCPYKVRRFNFRNYNLEIPETEKMMHNPEVTVRFRGVIEKCSYCVQRIQKAKIGARRDGRDLKDGDVVAACQQACPAQAIYFGDIRDPESQVSKMRAVDRNYGLLTDVGTRPRTRFLGKVRNPNPAMTAEEKQG